MENDANLQAMKDMMIGRTITDVTTKTNEYGDFYHVLHFGDGAYHEYLAAFTATDHQIAIAKDIAKKLAAREDLDAQEKIRLILETFESIGK